MHFAGKDGDQVWKLKPDLTLGGILASKEWDRVVRVPVVETGQILNLRIREIFHAVQGIFFSHSWNDHSVVVRPSPSTQA